MKGMDIRLWMFLIIVVLALLMLQQCGARKNAETDLAMAQQNIHAMNDTITLTKDRLGNAVYEKSVFITSEKGLKDLNKDLYDQVKSMNGKVAQLTSIIASLSTQHDEPVIGQGTQVGNPCDSIGTYTVDWNNDMQYDSSNYRKLSAITEINVSRGKLVGNTTQIKVDEIGFNILTGLEEKTDGHYEIFVKSDYPGFKPTKIDGAFIPREKLFPPQKKKNWSVGAGLQTGVGMGGLTQVGPVWYVGLGLSIQYTFLRF